MQSYLLNYPAEPRTRKGFYEQTYTLLKLCPRRRLLHKCIGAFAGLAGYMAGLRFSYVRKFGAGLSMKERMYKPKPNGYEEDYYFYYADIATHGSKCL